MDAGITLTEVSSRVGQQVADGSLSWPQAFALSVFFIACAYVLSIVAKRVL